MERNHSWEKASIKICWEKWEVTEMGEICERMNGEDASKKQMRNLK